MERANMKRVVEVVTMKQAEQKKLEDEKKRQQGEQQATAKSRSWYKFW